MSGRSESRPPATRERAQGRGWRWVIPIAAVGVAAGVLWLTARTPTTGVESARDAGMLETNSRAAMLERSRTLDARVPTSVPRVLVTGDSVALSLAAGAPLGPEAPFAVATAGLLGCGISAGTPLGVSRPTAESTCRQWPRIWRRGIDVFAPRAVVLLAGAWESFDRTVDGRVLRVGSPELRRRVLVQLAHARRIAAAGRAQLVLLTTPCFEPRSSGSTGELRALGESRRIDWFNGVLEEFAAAEPQTVSIVDLHEIACPDGEYLEEIGGVPQRIDGVHFTPAASARIWQQLTPELLQSLAGGPRS